MTIDAKILLYFLNISYPALWEGIISKNDPKLSISQDGEMKLEKLKIQNHQKILAANFMHIKAPYLGVVDYVKTHN